MTGLLQKISANQEIQSLRVETMAIGRSLYRYLMTVSEGLKRRGRVLIATMSWH